MPDQPLAENDDPTAGYYDGLQAGDAGAFFVEFEAEPQTETDHNCATFDRCTPDRCWMDVGAVAAGIERGIATIRDRQQATESDRIARVLMAAWEEAEGKPVNPSHVATFADMARAVLDTLGARTERRWGVSLVHGVFETSEAGAFALSGEPPDSGPAVTCLRTTYAMHETPWVPLSEGNPPQ